MNRNIESILNDFIQSETVAVKKDVSKVSAVKKQKKDLPQRQIPSRVDPKSKTMFALVGEDLVIVGLGKKRSSAILRVSDLGQDGATLVKRWILTGVMVWKGKRLRSSFGSVLVELCQDAKIEPTRIDPSDNRVIEAGKGWALEIAIPRAR
jgi:hypothetical protein